ncbi:MAG: 2OG-Fe dioxygenase family protein [Stellaceae bacterium]
MRALLGGTRWPEWATFCRSWDDLGADAYMADGGRYRRRRYAAFAVSGDGIVRKPHQPHYQSRDYNPLNGGIERWFEPVADAVAAHPALDAILRACQTLFASLAPAECRTAAWHVEVHQFRIEARLGQRGHPTPEGIHRDGVDWALVLLVTRENIAEGTTTIYDLEKRPLSSFTLAEPLDAAFVDDHRVFHGVTPIEPADRSRPGHRDVLVVTFRRDGA